MSGAWSTLVVVGVIVGATPFVVAAGVDRPAAPGLSHAVGYYVGQAASVTALFTAVVGVPILARRYRVGFWRGLLAVVAALCWLVPPFLLLLALLGSASAILIAAGLHFLIAVVLAVILYRRRARRREPSDIADVFS